MQCDEQNQMDISQIIAPKKSQEGAVLVSLERKKVQGKICTHVVMYLPY